MNGRAAGKNLFVIFGATGDLMRHKLLPALFRLNKRGLVPPDSPVLGVARGELDDVQFRAFAKDALAKIAPAEEVARWCDRCLVFHSLGKKGDDYAGLAQRMSQVEKERGLAGHRVIYLALPLQAVPGTVNGLGGAGLGRTSAGTRLVIEKPFGYDLESAAELNKVLRAHFDDHQIYRIDHYLGKETVQNLLIFRFANAMFEPIWNRDRVSRVEITVAEENGVGARAGFYEKAGAFRDIIQNHLTQVLCLVAMEPPSVFTAEEIGREKVKVLKSVEPIDPGDAVFGRYTRGNMSDGKEVPGYLEEPDVPATSTTDTYAAMRLSIANWRWQGVPFFVRTGKRLERKVTRIVVSFRCPPVSMFAPQGTCVISSNTLEITLQPDEGFDLSFQVKSPGPGVDLATQRMHFRYAEAFGALDEAYEKLLLDAMRGDETNFVRSDEVEYAWRLYTPVLESPRTLHEYRAGTWGPKEADRLFEGYGPCWTPV